MWKAIDPKDLVALKVQHELADAWQKLAESPASPVGSDTQVHILPSIQHAVELVEKVNGDAGQTDVLVTGSLHLIGGIFEVAQLEFAL
jgi:folylpolyglutamate synthase